MKDLFIESFFDQQTISLGKENVFGKLGNGNVIWKGVVTSCCSVNGVMFFSVLLVTTGSFSKLEKY